MHFVKVEGKTLAQLKFNLEVLLEEMEEFVATSKPAKKLKAVVTENGNVEYEEVESPYADHATHVNAHIDISTPRVASGELDSEGLPWDSRIHASSKAKVANGTWRTKRGADENEVYKIKAELRGGVVSNPVVTATPVQPPVVAPIQQTLAPAPLPPMQNSGHTVDTFKANFALVIANLITEGKVTQDYVNELKKYFNVVEIWMINDEQKAQVFESFVQYGFVQKVG